MPPWLNSKLTMLPWCPLSLSPCLNLSHRAFGIHIASWWFQGFLERKQQQQNKPFFHGKVQGCLPYGEMGRLLPGYLPLQLILPSCLDEKGPSLMVSLSGPCIICRQFRGEEIAFCLINNSTVCQNQASPTFPTVQASGMLGIKSWTELFLTFGMILLQTMTPLGVNTSENTKCSLPVDLAICKTIRESIGRGFKKWKRQFINSSWAYSLDCQGN